MIRRILRWFLAITHLNQRAVCEESAGMGLADYHDYYDDEEGLPLHFCTLTCRHCGKKFTI